MGPNCTLFVLRGGARTASRLSESFRLLLVRRITKPNHTKPNKHKTKHFPAHLLVGQQPTRRQMRAATTAETLPVQSLEGGTAHADKLGKGDAAQHTRNQNSHACIPP